MKNKNGTYPCFFPQETGMEVNMELNFFKENYIIIKGLIVLRVAWSIQGWKWPFRSWNEKSTKIQKYHPYTPKTFYFSFIKPQ